MKRVILANMCWHILKYNGTWLINLCKYSRLLYYPSDLRVKVYSTSGSIIPALASRASHKSAEKYTHMNYTRVTSLVFIYINKIPCLSVCLFICLFVCLFVLKLLLGKWVSMVAWYIAGYALIREPKLYILEPIWLPGKKIYQIN